MTEFITFLNGKKLRIYSPSAGVWRITGSFGDTFENEGAAQFLADRLDGGFKESLRELEFRGGTLICGNDRLEISGLKVSFSAGNIPVSVDFGGFTPAAAVFTGSLSSEERIYGTGERFNAVNQRGKNIILWAVDEWCQTEGNSYVPVPFFMSTNGYAVFFNRFERAILDLDSGNTGKWTMTSEGSPLDVYLFVSDKPENILLEYSKLTGFSPMPDDWVFGIQVSRHGCTREFASPKGVYEMMKQMEARDLPWDAVILEGWETYDRSTHAALKSLADDVHKKGKNVLVYEGCGRISGFTEKTYGSEKIDKYSIHEGKTGSTELPESHSNNPKDAPVQSKRKFVDITNPEALSWWQNEVWADLIRGAGVQGSKIDFCEQLPDYLDLRFAGGEKSNGAHHWYPTIYNVLMYRYFKANSKYGAMNFSRGGYTGAQRYPVIWAGDQRREYRFLRHILISMLSSGLSGIPFMSHDMAAYQPASDPKTNPEPKVFVRGTEFGCFTVNMETHGEVTRPYDFDDRIVDIYRTYTKLHEAIIPYIHEQAEISCGTGIPLMRHLFLYDRDDKNVYDIEDEYMYGGSFLVAPVLDDRFERDIYLPAGRWSDLISGKVLNGKQWLRAYKAPFEKIPVFLNLDTATAEAEKAAARISATMKELC